MRDVVVSGLGSLSCCGCGNDALARALADGRPRLSEVDRSSYYRSTSGQRARGATLGGTLNGTDLSAWLKPAAARRMSPLSRLAVVAARIATRTAGEETPFEDYETTNPGATGVFLSCAYGPTSYTERILRQVFEEGPTCVSPSLFTESVANAPAAQIALQLGIRGPNVTVTQREAGPLAAIALGSAEIRAGRCHRVLVGGVDELTPLMHAVLDEFRALARARPGLSERARPFDRRRNGFVAAEGACVLVLESAETALQRGANVLARVVLSVNGFDPEAPSTGWSRCPQRLARTLSRKLERAGIAPEEIDLIVSGANGSIAGDRLEAHVLRAVWGQLALPPVVTPKAITGELGSSTLSAAVLACQGQPFGRIADFEPDPELGIVPHNGALPSLPKRILVSALAVGGAAAWLLLENLAVGNDDSDG